MKKLILIVVILIFAAAGVMEFCQEPASKQEEQQDLPVSAALIEYEKRSEQLNSVFDLTSGSIVLEQSQNRDEKTLNISWWDSQEETLTLSTDQLMFLSGESYRIRFYVYSDLAERLVVRWGDESGAFDQSILTVTKDEAYFDLNYTHQKEDTYSGWISMEFHRKEDTNAGLIMMSQFSMTGLSDANHAVKINQVGYLPGSQKTAIFQDNSGDVFQVVNVNTNEVVYTGMILNQTFNEETGEINGYGDFSAVTEPGVYRIEAQINARSYDFVIEEQVYQDLRNSVLNMITLQRCGQTLPKEIAGLFSHESCHDDNATIYTGRERKDMTGGWHDAGDYGRYTLTTTKTINDLLLSYWVFPESFDDQTNGMESGNGIPDVLDEALVGLRWLKKMQLDWGPVYTAAVTQNFAGFIAPEKDEQAIYILDEENTSTAATAATFALGSLVMRSYDEGRADELLQDAIKAYQSIDKTDASEDKKNPWDISAGDYSNESVLDELYFAASALYAATHQTEYLDQAKALIQEHPEILMGFSYNDMGGYGSYLLLQDEVFQKQGEVYTVLYNHFFDHAKSLIGAQNNNGYQVVTNGYYWGGNMFVANNGMTLLLANALQPDAALVNAASEQLAYLLGKNSLNMSFITGYGQNYPRNIHHRVTEALNIELSGALVGGPDSSVDSSRPAAKKYWDESELYSTNEVTIYYNSPVVFLLSGLN